MLVDVLQKELLQPRLWIMEVPDQFSNFIKWNNYKILYIIFRLICSKISISERYTFIYHCVDEWQVHFWCKWTYIPYTHNVKGKIVIEFLVFIYTAEHNIKMQLLFMHYWLCWRAELQKSIFILLLLPHSTAGAQLTIKYWKEKKTKTKKKSVCGRKIKSCLFNSFSYYLSRQWWDFVVRICDNVMS